MEINLRPAQSSDFKFAFETKRQAMGPHIIARWGWDEAFQRELHRKRWNERPWSIIQADGQPIGTLSVQEHKDHIRFGEFYLLPQYQRQGIGSKLLQSVLERSDVISLPVRLEYLKWNPVGSLYRRHGFKVISENEVHYFLVCEPVEH